MVIYNYEMKFQDVDVNQRNKIVEVVETLRDIKIFEAVLPELYGGSYMCVESIIDLKVRILIFRCDMNVQRFVTNISFANLHLVYLCKSY